MIRTLSVTFALLWLFGLATSHTLGGWIHFSILAAVALMMAEIIRGRKIPKWLPLSPRRLNSNKSFPFDPTTRE
jgi:hypothetical protein